MRGRKHEHPECLIEGCDKPPVSRGWCDMHYTRWKRHGDPATRIEVSGSQRAPWPSVEQRQGPEHSNWKGDDLTYRGAHTRLQRLRGPASSFLCECGEEARQWAFKYDSPADSTVVRYAAITKRGRTWQVAYSPNVEDYVPMCVACHMRFDRASAA